MNTSFLGVVAVSIVYLLAIGLFGMVLAIVVRLSSLSQDANPDVHENSPSTLVGS